MHLRTVARELFLEALQSVDVRSSVRHALTLSSTHLHIAGTLYNLGSVDNMLLVAIGKAALPMTEGLLEALQTTPVPLTGVVIGSALPTHPDIRLLYRLGSHPLPTASSAEAATLVLNLLATATDRTLILFLLSGGASAMCEHPLDPNIGLTDLIAFHQTLVHSALSIAEMNTLRKHLSAVKGGRLATAAPAALKCTLLVSDVPPSQAEVIGSGPSLPDPTTLADCQHLLAARLSHALIPPSIAAFFNDPETPETPKSNDPAFRRAAQSTLLSSDNLALAAEAAARSRGFRTLVDRTPDEWNFADASTYLLQRLHELARTYPDEPVCLINTGEVSVPVSIADPGTGGRNQHFVLHTALALAQTKVPITVLSAGSDGADGNSPAAGGVADHTTLQRATQLGLHPAEALARFNAYSVLDALGDALLTGPTGNNLRDLRLFLLDPR